MLAHRTYLQIGAFAILALAYKFQDRLRASLTNPLTSLPSHTTSMSAQQKALYIVEPKGKLEIRTREIQEPGPGEVLVEIHATALNPVDWKVHAYDYFVKEYPGIVGTDSAGIVKKVGEGVTNVAVGDRVYVY